MASPAAYSDLNPFISTSIGETDLWQNGIWADVPSIHAAQFEALANAVSTTRRYKRTQVRFVRGAGGSGKSHLFARLRREMADSIFYAYAANPPRQPEALEPFLLNRLIGSLRHPARARDGSSMPYSQLRHLAYALLRPVVEQEVTLDQLHDAWMQIPLPEQKNMIHQALLLLEEEHPLVPRSVLRAVLSTLRGDKEHLAAQWLSGATYLSENDLRYLAVPEPLKREDAGTVMQLLGRLAAQAGLPFVLVLDQLDLFTKPEELDEFQRLLFSLIDQSTNWVVFIGLISDRFVTWDAAMSQALRGRIGVPDAKAPLGFRLSVVDVLPIGPADKRALLEKRLASPDLAAQRAKDGLQSPLHPMTVADIDELIAGGAIFPRHLLASAAERFDERASGRLDLPSHPAPAPATAEKPKIPEPGPSTPSSPAPTPAPAAPMAGEKPKPETQSPMPTPPTSAKPPAPPPAAAPTLPKPPPPETATALTPSPAAAPKPAPSPAPSPPPAAVPIAAAVAGTAAIASKVTPKPGTNPLSPPTAKPVPVAATTPAVAKTPLKEKMTELLAKAIAASKSADATPSPVDLGERVRDLVELMAGSKVIVRPGDLKDSYAAFDGTDQIFTWGGGTLRIVATDAVRNSFIATLERLQAIDGPLLLLRHAVAPVSGVRTVELVNDIKRRHRFHHVAASESDVLNALGSVLASLREGSYENLPTEPPATADHVHAALRGLPVIQNHCLWETIRSAHGSKAQGTNGTTPAPSGPPPAPELAKPKSTLAAIAASTARVAAPPKPNLPPPSIVTLSDSNDAPSGGTAVPVTPVAKSVIPPATPPPTPAKFPPAPDAKHVPKTVTKQVTPPPLPTPTAHRAVAPPLPPKPKPPSK